MKFEWWLMGLCVFFMVLCANLTMKNAELEEQLYVTRSQLTELRQFYNAVVWELEE